MKILRIILLLLAVTVSSAQSDETCAKAIEIIQLAKEYHVSPRAIDDAYSVIAFDHFIELLDDGARLLTLEDITLLKSEKLNIDNNIKDNSCRLVSKAQDIYLSRLIDVTRIISESTPLCPTLKDHKQFNNGRSGLSGLTTQWENNLQYYTLTSYFMKTEEDSCSYEHFKKEYPTLFAEIKETLLCRFKELETQLRDGSYVENCYLKSLSYAFDPHSEFLAASEEEDFVESLSTSHLAFGFSADRNLLGDIYITSLYPGGPAWKSNLINEGDVILQFENDNEEYTLECGNIKAAFDFIGSDDLKKAHFKLRKKDGKVVEVLLQKEALEQEINSTNGFILEGTPTIGYIYLPAFYTSYLQDQQGKEGRCSADLTKELLKFKLQKVEGLILDLRNNGGGSLSEAVTIAGAFVDKGTITILDNQNEITTIKDPLRGISYAGPLIILVNEWSASASELLAGTLQDYDRAIIVGQSTYGKASMQEILPLDKNEGYLKLTTGAFYRVTGKSHQGIGVKPDILLSSNKLGRSHGESSYSSCLTFGKIEKKAYYKKVGTGMTHSIMQAANERISQKESDKTSHTKDNAEDIEALPLSFKTFQSYYNSDKDIASTKAEKAPYNVKLLKVPTFTSETDLNSLSTEVIEEDTSIYECYRILQDIIQNNKSK